MAVDVVIPRLGWTMEEGTLVEWVKHDGDSVAQGDVLFTVETDKSLNEVESFETGVLRIPPDSPTPGTTLPVGALIAYLVQPGEPAPFEARESSGARGGAEETHRPAAAPGGSPSQAGDADAAAGTRAGVSSTPADATGRTEPNVSPRARRTAAELGVEWKDLSGSGITGRIVERDVRAAVAQQAEAAAQSRLFDVSLAPATTAQPAAEAVQRSAATSETTPAATGTSDATVAREAEEGTRGVKASPLAKRLAQEAGINLAVLASLRPGAIIQRADVEAAIAARETARSQPADTTPPLSEVTAQPGAAAAEADAGARSVKASPLAKRLAKEAGIDLAALAAARPGAVIQRADVEAAIAAHQASEGRAQQVTGLAAALSQDQTPVAPTEMRRGPQAQTPATSLATTDRTRRQADERADATAQAVTVTQPIVPAAAAAPGGATVLTRDAAAKSIAESAHATAPVTLVTEADATELVILRDRIGAALSRGDAEAPTSDDLIVKLVAVALKEHPVLNSSWQDGKVIMHPEIHIGLLLDTGEGPVCPVIHSAPSRSLREIAALSSSLTDKARDGLLTSDDAGGATFTVCSLGAYGVDAFTPIISLPQCAILGVGRIAKKPAVHEGQIVPRDLLTLSLTFDHRIVDGAPAARFLSTVREYVEQPLLWLSML